MTDCSEIYSGIVQICKYWFWKDGSLQVNFICTFLDLN